MSYWCRVTLTYSISHHLCPEEMINQPITPKCIIPLTTEERFLLFFLSHFYNFMFVFLNSHLSATFLDPLIFFVDNSSPGWLDKGSNIIGLLEIQELGQEKHKRPTTGIAHGGDCGEFFERYLGKFLSDLVLMDYFLWEMPEDNWGGIPGRWN